MLPKPHRLHKNKDFQNVFENGQRAVSKSFVLLWAPNSLEVSRFGIIASKKIGHAVTRHRAARLLRESLRHQLTAIQPGLDFILIARRHLSLKKQPEVEQELRQLFKKHHLLK